MTRRAAFFGLVLVSCVACRRANEGQRVDSGDAGNAPAIASIAIDTGIHDVSENETGGAAMRDDELGALVARLSEDPGAFPSDNFVSNESSYLDVAPVLRDPKLRRRAYVGVGPEQNLTYLSILEPEIAYIVDIRRGNLLEHMVLRGCMEAGGTRALFLQALLARRAVGDATQATPTDAGFEPLAAAFIDATPDRALRDEGVARTRALMRRLNLPVAAHDEEDIARIHDAFFTHGLSIRFTMKSSFRTYPTLAEILAQRDPSGVEASFLSSEEAYARVRRLVLENRVVPVIGDFGGKHALSSVAADMRARGLTLGVFYTSNVEQYLFDARTYPSFVDSVEAMPRDDASTIVRVWFDQGEPHPAQQKGRRTTQIAIPANVFLDRARSKPFHSYWEVANLSP